MKIKIAALTTLLIATCVSARIIAPFLGWDRLQEESPNIIVARCGKPTLPTPGVLIMNAPSSDFTVKVMAILKGTNNASFARLQTDHELRQGENYLVFGYYDGGIYQAYEEYRVVPLGTQFSTNWIAGKSLDEQIQILFQRSIGNLNREIQKDQEEKARLEEGLQKQDGNQ